MNEQLANIEAKLDIISAKLDALTLAVWDLILDPGPGIRVLTRGESGVGIAQNARYCEIGVPNAGD